jgi:hypothetical protein
MHLRLDLKQIGQVRSIRKCPSGGIGIRARLKIVSRKRCGSDPHLGHSRQENKKPSLTNQGRLEESGIELGPMSFEVLADNRQNIAQLKLVNTNFPGKIAPQFLRIALTAELLVSSNDKVLWPDVLFVREPADIFHCNYHGNLRLRSYNPRFAFQVTIYLAIVYTHPELRIDFYAQMWYKKCYVSYPPIAQLVEQIPLKDKVAGSNPAGRTRYTILLDKKHRVLARCFFFTKHHHPQEVATF